MSLANMPLYIFMSSFVPSMEETGSHTCPTKYLSQFKDEIEFWSEQEGVVVNYEWVSPLFSRIYLEKLSENEIVWSEN